MDIDKLRGPQGPRGPEGLSAYGVWLAEGNVGTAQDFLASLKMGGRFALLMHVGGQAVQPGGAVALAGKVARGLACMDGGIRIERPGSFFVRYYAAARGGSYALFVNGIEQPGTRFQAGGAAFAVTALDIASAPADIKLVNVSAGVQLLEGSSGSVDAYIHITSVD